MNKAIQKADDFNDAKKKLARSLSPCNGTNNCNCAECGDAFYKVDKNKN